MAKTAIVEVLPEVFARTAETSAPLRALLEVGDDLHAPIRALLDEIEHVVNPYAAQSRLVPSLSRWVDLDWLTMPSADVSVGPQAGLGTERQRDLIANAAELSATRGTAAGLARFLQLATGVAGFEVRVARASFHFQVVVPGAAAGQLDLVARILRGIKPAHLTHEVVVAK